MQNAAVCTVDEFLLIQPNTLSKCDESVACVGQGELTFSCDKGSILGARSN